MVCRKSLTGTRHVARIARFCKNPSWLHLKRASARFTIGYGHEGNRLLNFSASKNRFGVLCWVLCTQCILVKSLKIYEAKSITCRRRRRHCRHRRTQELFYFISSCALHLYWWLVCLAGLDFKFKTKNKRPSSCRSVVHIFGQFFESRYTHYAFGQYVSFDVLVNLMI